MDNSNVALPLCARANSNTPEPMPCIGLARSALPPSAAIVKAARQINWAVCGNVSNSFRADLSHEMGRVTRVICRRYFTPPANVVISDNEGQVGSHGWCFPNCGLWALHWKSLRSEMVSGQRGRGRMPVLGEHPRTQKVWMHMPRSVEGERQA